MKDNSRSKLSTIHSLSSEGVKGNLSFDLVGLGALLRPIATRISI